MNLSQQFKKFEGIYRRQRKSCYNNDYYCIYLIVAKNLLTYQLTEDKLKSYSRKNST